jgi:hypothetical protein
MGGSQVRSKHANVDPGQQTVWLPSERSLVLGAGLPIATGMALIVWNLLCQRFYPVCFPGCEINNTQVPAAVRYGGDVIILPMLLWAIGAAVILARRRHAWLSLIVLFYYAVAFIAIGMVSFFQVGFI